MVVADIDVRHLASHVYVNPADELGFLKMQKCRVDRDVVHVLKYDN